MTHPSAVFPQAPGSAAERIRSLDWAATPLGPPRHWPAALRCAVELMLNSPESMYLTWGPRHVFLHNDAYAPILGPRLETAMGRPLQLVWADAWEAVEAPIAQALAGKSSRHENVPVAMNRHGVPEDTWWTFSFSPLHAEDGTVGGTFCVTREVTQAMVAQAKLARENERLIALFDRSPMFMAFLSGPDHRIELANPEYVRLIGDREVIGKPLREALPEVLDQGYLSLLDGVYHSGAPFIGSKIAYAAPVQDAPTPRAHLLDIVFQPVKDEHGEVAGVFIQGLDVTPQVALQRRLRLSEARNRQIMDSAQDYAIFAMDLEGRVTLWNEGARRILGWTEQQMMGQTPERFYVGDDAAAGQFQRNMQAALAQGGIRGERRYRRKDGELFWAHGAMRVLKDEEGTAVGFVTVLRDASAERDAAEQLRQLTATLEERVRERTDELLAIQEKLRQSQKMEAVGQLTGGIAHDFNNMLTAVSMGLELLEMRVEQQRYDDLQRYVDMARSGADRATALTQRLLAFSRRQTLAPSAVNVERMVEGMLDIIARSLGPSIRIVTRFEGGEDVVLVDVPQLENALLNLCINARDAMPGGGVLTLSAAAVELGPADALRLDVPAGRYVRLSVQDTGLGMAPEVVEKVFEPFFTTKPIGQGTGLGLSMIYGFTRQSGGQVEIDSRPGEGTTMHLYLPRFDGSADAPPAGRPRRAVASDAGPHRRVLLVEDETTIRVLVKEVLGAAGYDVTEVAEGSAAVEILQSSQPVDLLITDVGLTGPLNGRQVADAGRQSRPELPVLFITGYAAAAAVGAGQLEPGMALLTKPFSSSDLEDRIAALLRARRPG